MARARARARCNGGGWGGVRGVGASGITVAPRAAIGHRAWRKLVGKRDAARRSFRREVRRGRRGTRRTPTRPPRSADRACAASAAPAAATSPRARPDTIHSTSPPRPPKKRCVRLRAIVYQLWLYHDSIVYRVVWPWARRNAAIKFSAIWEHFSRSDGPFRSR